MVDSVINDNNTEKNVEPCNVKDLEKKIDEIYELLKKLEFNEDKDIYHEINSIYNEIISNLKVLSIDENYIRKKNLFRLRTYKYNDKTEKLSEVYQKKLKYYTVLIKALRCLQRLYYHKKRFNYLDKRFNITNHNGKLYSKEYYSIKDNIGGKNKAKILLVDMRILNEIGEDFIGCNSSIKRNISSIELFNNIFPQFQEKIENEINDYEEKNCLIKLGKILLNIYDKIKKDEEFNKNCQIIQQCNSINSDCFLSKSYNLTYIFFIKFSNTDLINEDYLEKLKKEGNIDENNHLI